MARGKYSHWHREGWVHRTKDLGRVRPKARTNTKSADPWQASEDRDEIIEASEILASRSPQALLPTSTPSLGQRYFMLTRPGHLTLLIASLFCGLQQFRLHLQSATTQGPLPPQKESYAVSHFLASSSLGKFHGTTLCLSAFWILHARETRATRAKLPVLDLVRSSNTLASLNQNV